MHGILAVQGILVVQGILAVKGILAVQELGILAVKPWYYSGVRYPGGANSVS